MTEESSLLEHLLQDRTLLRRVLLVSGQGSVLQIGKYNIHIGQGQNLHIGDRLGTPGLGGSKQVVTDAAHRAIACIRARMEKMD